MPTWLVSLLDNPLVLRVNAGIGIALFVIFIIYFFSKEGRDERGRKIIAIASLSAFLALFIIMNVLGGFGGNGWGIENVTRTMNLLQTGYTIVLLVADVAILIVRKTKISSIEKLSSDRGPSRAELNLAKGTRK